MTYEEAFVSLKNEFMKHSVADVDGHFAYQFNLTGDCAGAFYAEVKDGIMYVEPYNYYDRDAEITASYETLMGLTKGEVDPIKAFFSGKIKVAGSTDKALKLINVLKK
jgi:putative sterol carrier protein